MQLMDNSQFGLPQFGQQYNGFSLPQFGGFAGPSGFAGDMPSGGGMGGLLGGGMSQGFKPQGMFGGMAPMFGMAGQMIQQHPQSTAGVLGGLGIGGILSLLRHHGGGM